MEGNDTQIPGGSTTLNLFEPPRGGGVLHMRLEWFDYTEPSLPASAQEE